MSTDEFTRDQFESVLSEIAQIVTMPWYRDGLMAGEEHYHFVARTWDEGEQGLAIEIRSSIGRNGKAAGSGENSIRCWFSNANNEPVGNKAKRWITRLPNWDSRLTETLVEMAEVSRRVKLCPDCGKMMNIFVAKKEGPNKSRWFQKCWDHNHFEWLTEPAKATKPHKSKQATGGSAEVPNCPKCGAQMVRRERRSDGQPFWGCSGYPGCNGVRALGFSNGEVNGNAKAGSDDTRSKPSFIPSRFQEAIFEFVKDPNRPHGVVEALAGSGKTTTIVECLKYTDPESSVAFVAFNRHIALELAKRAPRHVSVSTLHSLGFAACKKAWGGKLLVQDSKLDKILEAIMDKYTHGVVFPIIKRLVSLVKANLVDPSDENLDNLAQRYGIGLFSDREVIFNAVRLALQVSFDERSVRIDFDDMIWLPVVSNLQVEEFDFLFVDEAQDLNRCQIELCLMSIKEGGRILAVGDRHQSMYGFRGADTEAIPNIISELAAETMPLSITYRNPKSHVKLVNDTFPTIPLEAAEWAEEGSIRELEMQHMILEAKSGDMVICRTNAPLVKPAFSMIRNGKKAVIRGRDIGKDLVLMIRKMKADSLVDLLGKLVQYRNIEVAKLIAAEKNGMAQALEDKVDTLVALADGTTTVTELEHKIESVFSDDVEGVVFSSVHRAKGLEADSVYILRVDLMPHPMAKAPWEQIQEGNIQYVAFTRSKRDLVFVH